MNRYKECRLASGMSQKFVALSVGVSPPMVSQWESDVKKPSKETLLKLADLFNVSTDYLLGREVTAGYPSGRENGQKRKEPAAMTDDELRAAIISRVQDLPDPALPRVADFLSGLQAGREVAAAQEAVPDPDEESRP